MVLSTSLASSAYCSRGSIEEKLALHLGWLSRVLVHLSGDTAAGSQGLLVFLLIQARALQRPTQSSEQQEKKISSGP